MTNTFEVKKSNSLVGALYTDEYQVILNNRTFYVFESLERAKKFVESYSVPFGLGQFTLHVQHVFRIKDEVVWQKEMQAEAKIETMKEGMRAESSRKRKGKKK